MEDEQLKKHIENMNAVARDYPENLLLSHVYIYWSEDRVWYRAKIIRYLEATKKFKVVYDDKT